MATSDIALERVQALLKVDTGDGTLYNHVVRIVRQLLADKPADALAQLESLSRHVKRSTFRGARAPDAEQDIVADVAAEEKRQKWCLDSMQMVRPPSDPASAPKVLCFVQNFLEDAAMFEWAGVGFGRQESYHVALSLRKLAAEVPLLDRLRIWGKVLGTEGDYYVAEGTMRAQEGAVPAPAALPGTPEYDVEPHGEGANASAYWVSAGGAAPWIRLPAARASHIVAARSIKHMLTGNLASPVISTPWFPGKERHLLRSQIARITSTCLLSVKDYYEMEEDDDGKKTMKEREGAEVPPPEELRTEAGWQHMAPFLLSTGKSSWPDLDALQSLAEEGQFSEDLVKELTKQKDDEPGHEMLEGLEEDLAELKPDGAPSPAWSIRVYGDQGAYTVNDEKKLYCVTAVRSLVWPGAVTVSQGSRFANLYIGYAMKCGTLVPSDKESGLPLRGTSPFMPLVPDDIMDEPPDTEEQEEPNPQADDGGSDGEDFDEGDGEDA